MATIRWNGGAGNGGAIMLVKRVPMKDGGGGWGNQPNWKSA